MFHLLPEKKTQSKNHLLKCPTPKVAVILLVIPIHAVFIHLNEKIVIRNPFPINLVPCRVQTL